MDRLDSCLDGVVVRLHDMPCEFVLVLAAALVADRERHRVLSGVIPWRCVVIFGGVEAV